MLSPWLAADEDRVSHVLSHVVWWKKITAWCFPVGTYSCESRCLFTFGLLQVLVIFFHSVYPFGISGILFLFLHLSPKLFSFVCMRFFNLSLCLLHRLDKIFFRCFGRSCFVCIAWRCSDIFWVFLLSPVYFGLLVSIVLSVLSAVFFFFFFFCSSFHCILVYFSFLSSFICYRIFFICPSNLISHPDFLFQFLFLRGIAVLITDWFY